MGCKNRFPGWFNIYFDFHDDANYKEYVATVYYTKWSIILLLKIILFI